MARREALAVAVVVATTFGGWSAQHAQANDGHASQAAGVASAPAVVQHLSDPADISEAVFSFGDALERVNYQLGFEPEARDAAALHAACAGVLAAEPQFATAITDADKAKDVAADLRQAASPTVSFCRASSPDEDLVERALDGYLDFREAAFDFAAKLAA